MPVPKRIFVLGAGGAGKTTLARRIGERLGLPVVHLDAIYWSRGWVQSEVGLFRQKVAELAARDAWVMEGNYSDHLDLRLPRAEVVIWLDLPRYVYFSRAVWRSIRSHRRERDDLAPGCPDRFYLSFLANWVWTYPKRCRARDAQLMSSLPAGIYGIILTSRREVAQFEDDLPHSLEISAGNPCRSPNSRSAA